MVRLDYIRRTLYGIAAIGFLSIVGFGIISSVREISRYNELKTIFEKKADLNDNGSISDSEWEAVYRILGKPFKKSSVRDLNYVSDLEKYLTHPEVKNRE